MEGKVPAVMERFTIERIVGDNALEIFFSTVVGSAALVAAGTKWFC